jgi:hypothetical protein
MEFIDSGEFKVRLYFAPEAVAYRGDASNVWSGSEVGKDSRCAANETVRAVSLFRRFQLKRRMLPISLLFAWNGWPGREKLGRTATLIDVDPVYVAKRPVPVWIK